MKILFLVVALTLLSGCATWQAMSDSEKAMVVVGIIATTAIISSNDDTETIIREVCQVHGKHGCD